MSGPLGGAPLMEAAGGGSILTMTYLGGERAVPHYNVMGLAKAALDSSVQYLAWALGQTNIRINAVSARPVRTRAARSFHGFPTMEAIVDERAPSTATSTRTMWPPPPPRTSSEDGVKLLSSVGPSADLCEALAVTIG